MATAHYPAFLAIILLLQSYSTTANFGIPFLTPIFGGDPCQGDICGRGKCVASNHSTPGYECLCDNGWRQTRADDDQYFKFLPCVIPNCSINYNCEQAPPPAAHKEHNVSFFDPCYWADCGGGSCNQTSPVTHTCSCDEGYYNLFNSTAFPCYKDCHVGADCASIGTSMFNSSSPSPHSSSTVVNDSSDVSSLFPRVEFGWLVTIVATLELAVSVYS